MSNKAKKWAEDYFQRFEKMVNVLEKHPLINHIVYLKFKGLSDAEIAETEQKITVSLNEQAEDWDIENYPYQDVFVFDDYMKAFYKISNGLCLNWNSHLFPTSIEKDERLNDQLTDAMRFPSTDGSEIPEGRLCLFALENILNHANYGCIYGDPPDSSFGESLREVGGILSYIDYFNDYNDAAVTLQKGEKSSIILGHDHSASYNANYNFDFVMYMEFILSTYASTLVRSSNFTFESQEYFDVAEKFDAIFKTSEYSDLPALLQENCYTDLNTLLKMHFEEQGYEYGTLENFSSKSKSIYTTIETFLDIKIEDEFE